MAVEAFPDGAEDGAETPRPEQPRFAYNPMLRGYAPAAPIHEVFGAQARYVDTAKRRDIRALEEETELYVATFGEEQLDMEEVYRFLRNPDEFEWANRAVNRLTKIAVYLSGGFGSRILLEQIRDSEEKNRE
jgi:hypothetical protein